MSSLQANYAVLQYLKIRRDRNSKCQRTNYHGPCTDPNEIMYNFGYKKGSTTLHHTSEKKMYCRKPAKKIG